MKLIINWVVLIVGCILIGYSLLGSVVEDWLPVDFWQQIGYQLLGEELPKYSKVVLVSEDQVCQITALILGLLLLVFRRLNRVKFNK